MLNHPANYNVTDLTLLSPTSKVANERFGAVWDPVIIFM